MVRRRSGVFTKLLERLVLPVVGPLFTRSLLGTSMGPVSPLGLLSISLSSWTLYSVDIVSWWLCAGAPGPLPTCPRPPRQAASPPWTGSFVPPWLHSPTNTGYIIMIFPKNYVFLDVWWRIQWVRRVVQLMVIICDLILISSAGRGSTGSSLAAPLLTLGGLQCSSSW